MARIVFELEVGAPAAAVIEALDTADGIAGWWTADVAFRGGEGSTMTLGFPVAPKPFELRVDEVGDQRVRWTSVGDFPPHWSATTITWTLTPSDSGILVHFDHGGWADDQGAFPSAAMTWGQLMTSLKQYVETGQGTPLYRKP
ncbi:MAG: SRPBCC family protein [Kribbellaceae bacterium]